MSRYDPERMELSTRHRVALAACTEIKGGRGTPGRRRVAGRIVGQAAADPALRVNLVWSGPGSVERESIPPIPAETAALMREVSTGGKLVE